MWGTLLTILGNALSSFFTSLYSAFRTEQAKKSAGALEQKGADQADVINRAQIAKETAADTGGLSDDELDTRLRGDKQ